MECKTVKIKSSHPSQGDFVEINAGDFDAAAHVLYDAPLPIPPALMLPPPPPAPAHPLDGLGTNWRDRDDLRNLAAAVNGGRAVENKKQAVQVIEAALAARAGK